MYKRQTTYYVGVKAVCPYGITPASTIFIFTTAAGAVCDTPANPVASGITSNTATVSWDAMPDAIKYKISYRELPSGSWTTNNVFTNSRVLTGLNPNATYDYRLMTHCPSGLTPLGPANFFTTAASRLAAAGSLQDEMQIQLFPNPTNGIVNVVVSRPDVTPTGVGGAAYPARATIEVFDLVGRPVYRWEGDVQGTFIHPIDLSGNAEGQYLVKTSMNGKVESRVISLVK